jgi:hypothetical protein
MKEWVHSGCSTDRSLLLLLLLRCSGHAVHWHYTAPTLMVHHPCPFNCWGQRRVQHKGRQYHALHQECQP